MRRINALVSWAFAILLALSVCGGCLLFAAAMKPTCYQEGPFPADSAGANPSVREGLAFFPIGRTCQWSVNGQQIGYGNSGDALVSSMVYVGIITGGAGLVLTRRTAAQLLLLA
jgi:hypothetical protein